LGVVVSDLFSLKFEVMFGDMFDELDKGAAGVDETTGDCDRVSCGG